MKNDRIIVEVRLDSQPDNQQNQVIDFYLRSAIVRLPSMIRYIKREQEQQRCA